MSEKLSSESSKNSYLEGKLLAAFSFFQEAELAEESLILICKTAHDSYQEAKNLLNSMCERNLLLKRETNAGVVYMRHENTY